jgi:hypothetical protein
MDVINGKRNQIILKKGQGAGVLTESSRYGPLRRVLVTIGPDAQEPDIERSLNQLLHRGKLYHALARDDSLKDKLIEAYEAGTIGNGASIILCEKEVETVKDFFFFFFFTFRSFRRFLSYSSSPLKFGWQHPFSRLGKNPVVARLSPRGGGMLLS